MKKLLILLLGSASLFALPSYEKEYWNFISITSKPILPVPNGISYSLRKMSDGHGWEVGAGVTANRGYSVEATYLPYTTPWGDDKKTYFGVGGGFVSIKHPKFDKSAGRYNTPSLYVKPGIQMPFREGGLAEQKIEMQIGFPAIINFSYGVGF